MGGEGRQFKDMAGECVLWKGVTSWRGGTPGAGLTAGPATEGACAGSSGGGSTFWLGATSGFCFHRNERVSTSNGFRTMLISWGACITWMVSNLETISGILCPPAIQGHADWNVFH